MNDVIVGIVAQALWDCNHTSRLAEHPDAVDAYRVKARNLIMWIELLGGKVSTQDAPLHSYPTEDSYLAVCRVVHWRTAELRANGIEPMTIPQNAPHYPPEDFQFILENQVEVDDG